jgi:hypothetical protein
MEGGAVRHKFEMGLPKGYPNQIWFNLDQRFQRRRFKCDLLPKKCLICIIDKNRLKEKFQRKTRNMLNYSLLCSCSKNLSSFWVKLKHQWTIEENSIFCNSSHPEWRAELSYTLLKGTHTGTIPARLGLIWFSGFRGEDLNVKVYDVRRTDRQTDGRRTMVTNWWQKLTWPLARRAENWRKTFFLQRIVW